MGNLEGNNDIDAHLATRYLYQRIQTGYQRLNRIIFYISRIILNFQMIWVSIEILYRSMLLEFLVWHESSLYLLQIQASESLWMQPIYEIGLMGLLSLEPIQDIISIIFLSIANLFPVWVSCWISLQHQDTIYTPLRLL